MFDYCQPTRIHFDQAAPNPSVEMVQKGFTMLKERNASYGIRDELETILRESYE